MRKVLLISSEFPPGPGGIGYHAYSLCVCLNDIGFYVVAMSPADYVSEKEVLEFDVVQNFQIIRYPRISWKTYLHRWKITKDFLAGNHIDTVILTGKFSLWQGWLIKIFFKDQKTLAVLHGSEVNLKNSVLRGFTHLSINAADTIVSVSNFTRDLLPQWIRKKRVITIIPNGIFLTGKNLKSMGNLLDGFPKLITVGHVSPRKGQHRVIRALPKLRVIYPEIKYHIVGRPVNQSNLEVLAEELGVLDHIQFHGRIINHEDLEYYYQESDVFMLLSENQNDGDVEGFGIVALEANESGLPVIGAKYCGVEDAVSHGISGLLVDGNDINEICEAVRYCIYHRSKLSEGAHRWAQQHQWKEIVKEFEVLL